MGDKVGDFRQCHVQLALRMERQCKTQRIPGMNSDEVYAEMLYTLWKAWETYDSEVGTSVEQWWWVLWVRRKSDLIESFFAHKRRMEVLVENEGLELLADAVIAVPGPEEMHVVECPRHEGILTRLWHLLADGFTGVEVRKLLGIGVNAYYRSVDKLKTDDVRLALVA